MRAAASLLKRFLRLPADALIVSSKKLSSKISDAIIRDPRLNDKFYPYETDRDFFILLNSNSQQPDHANCGLPIPPQDLWAGYGKISEYFLSSGQADVATMKKILEFSDFRIQAENRLLDFGCASGRMMRWLADIAQRCEVWGVDISARHIIWCKEHLSPPFKFATVTTAPHLPFEDGYFDLIYCGSVFTHIADLADAWLLELKRIVRRGGRLYITIHDRHTIDLILNHPERIYSDGLPVDDGLRNLLLSYDQTENVTAVDFYMLTIGRALESQVFYDIDHLRRHWGQLFNVLSVAPEAYGYQTAIVLEK